MFYNMCFLEASKDIGRLSENQSLRQILFLGAIVISIFSVIFLFYTNSFLIKRRKKELGLFNILGMEKKHIAKIMILETLIIAFTSLSVGILGGILFSKLMLLMLFKIVSFKVSFGFEIPMKAVTSTFVLFSGIFALNLIYNIVQVHLSKPIELLNGGNVGEKEPRSKWILAIIGAICLGAGYYISLTTESPLAALSMFFIAVILVIIGTYCLFTAGSVVVLKMLRKNKKYYYKANHFTSVSGMIYRMKQNAAGLANICILSTMVIVMLSTTISLYVGMEDVLRTRYPRNIVVNADKVSDSEAKKIDAVIKEQVSKAATTEKNVIRYRSMEFLTLQKGDSFAPDPSNSYMSKNVAEVNFITLEDYNKMENKSVTLSKGEALLYTFRGKIDSSTINLNGFKLSIKNRLTNLNAKGEMTAMLTNGYYIVVNDVDTIKEAYNSLSGTKDDMGELSYYYAFDVSGSKDVQIKLVTALKNNISKGFADGAESSRASFYSIYGGLLFLGIFLGLLFIMATVLIIYYKQIAEGYEDKERFEIMKKVGMSHYEVKRAIQSQVLTVFFLPLVAAVIHLAFAFKVITKLLAVLNLTNVSLFAICAAIIIVVFAGFYAAVYAVTARTYYKIVS